MKINVEKGYVVKVLFVILLFIITALGVFSFRSYEENLSVQTKLIEEKHLLIKDLKITKDKLAVAILESKNFNSDLKIESEKVELLLKEIGNNNLDIATLLQYKRETGRLKNVVEQLRKDKELLFVKNKKLKIERDSAILVLGNAARYNDTLLAMNESLKKQTKKKKGISVVDLKVAPVMLEKKLDRYELTNKANKATTLKVNFKVVGSAIKNKELKQYYFQIIDSRGNVIGKRKSKMFGDDILYYSDMIEIWFRNKTLTVEQNLADNTFTKGTYIVNVFDKDQLISKTSFNLK
ncbi:hypothetical protein B4N84_16525 [Flavobacterium sp. IR1]|nr:hypothetical protein B4N84_16525 [Flavobacterium sp. IR1]